jgi:hypothetical protein
LKILFLSHEADSFEHQKKKNAAKEKLLSHQSLFVSPNVDHESIKWMSIVGLNHLKKDDSRLLLK